MNKDPVLAIDFGTVRIGLAISRYTLAEPLEIIPNDENKFIKLKELVVTYHIKKIIVGMSENEMAKKIENFTGELKNDIEKSWDSKPSIEFMDETLSSHSVHNKLKTAKKSKRGAHIDHYAAAEFLQEWLEENY